MLAMLAAVDDVLEEIGAGENAAPAGAQQGRRDRRRAPRRAAPPPPRRRARLRATGRGHRAAARSGSPTSSSQRLQPVELLLPYSEGGRLAELHDIAGELERADTPEGVRVKALAARATVAAALRALRAERREPRTARTPTDAARIRWRACSSGSRGSTRARRPRHVPTTATPASTSARSSRRRSSRASGPSCAPGSRSRCRPVTPGSSCRAPVSPRSTASRSSTPPA